MNWDWWTIGLVVVLVVLVTSGLWVPLILGDLL